MAHKLGSGERGREGKGSAREGQRGEGEAEEEKRGRDASVIFRSRGGGKKRPGNGVEGRKPNRPGLECTEQWNDL